MTTDQERTGPLAGPDTVPAPQSSILRKLAVGIAGVVVILIGIPLIPLFGPGWLIVFTGLAILSTEFAWAARVRDRIRDRLRAFMGKSAVGNDG